jgi:hypothetical protein
MRKEAKPLNLVQLNLPLLNAPKTTASDDKQRELAVALVELLISAAQEGERRENNGDADEPETHC